MHGAHWIGEWKFVGLCLCMRVMGVFPHKFNTILICPVSLDLRYPSVFLHQPFSVSLVQVTMANLELHLIWLLWPHSHVSKMFSQKMKAIVYGKSYTEQFKNPRLTKQLLGLFCYFDLLSSHYCSLWLFLTLHIMHDCMVSSCLEVSRSGLPH